MKIAGRLLLLCSAATWAVTFVLGSAWLPTAVAEGLAPGGNVADVKSAGAAAPAPASLEERRGRELHPLNLRKREAAARWTAAPTLRSGAHAQRNLKGMMMMSNCLPQPTKKKGMMAMTLTRCAPAPTRAPRMPPSSRPSARPSSAPSPALPSAAPSEDFCASLTTNPQNGHLYAHFESRVDWLAASDAARGLKPCCNKRAHFGIHHQPERERLCAHALRC
jgi:hypothetical protein